MKDFMQDGFKDPISPQLDLSEVFVYREKDLLDIFDEFSTVLFMILRMLGIVIDQRNAVSDRLRSQLLALPQIQKALRRNRG